MTDRRLLKSWAQRYVDFLEDNNFIETNLNYEKDSEGKVVERVSKDGKNFKNKVKLYSLPVLEE